MSEILAFISTATERFYNVPTQSPNETTEGALVDFIHNPRAYLLQACLSDKKQIRFFTEIQASVNKSIIFYKNTALELTAPDALNKVNMITLTTGAAESLYQVLRLVYSPMLAIGDDLFSGKLQKNLLELESNLRVLTHGEEGENIKVILCVEDEMEYWKALGDKRDAKKVEKDAACAFCVLFEDICEEIRALQSTSMQEVKESAENIAGILDDVWRYTPLPYSQERMVHILDIVGHVICSVTRRAVSEAGVWAARGQRAAPVPAPVPADAPAAVRAWTGACSALTHTYWPNYALHEWKGKPYEPVFCNRFQKRLEEIQEIRGTYDQLDKLLTKSERAELNSDRLLEPFRNINVWICNGPDRTWENAVAKFSADIRPAEAKIAEKLKPRLQNMSPKQSLYEFQRYRTLVSRPGVRHVLTRELQLLVSSLLELLRATEKALKVDQGEQAGGRGEQAIFRPPEMTSLVASVQWARHMEDKVKEIETCVENYLKDFDQSAEVLQLASKLQKDLKSMYTQLYEDWSRNIQVQLKDGSLQLSDRPVVEFSTTDRLMVVNFPPGLVRAEGEARALCAVGLAPPAAAALQRLTAPLKYARALHQVASFHNTLAERAVCSTRPLLLRSALALSALVGEQHAPCWDDEAQLERYTRRLKDEVLALEKQNNYLTDRHLKIRTIVEKLMDTELLGKLPEWKKGINDIRDIIEKVEADGFANTELWRSHWDLQLYKAMECQYIGALLSLHTHFPNVRVDLVLRGGAVRVQPAEEELRARLYALLRRLVALPTTLQGLGPTGGAPSFAEIVDKHGWLGNGAVSQLESVLGGVGRACGRWTRRAALCCVPVRELCGALTAPDHWDLNFRACKAYGQEVAKMTFDDEKIEWITISTVSLRREFEAQARNLWAGLMTSLTASCRDDAAELEAFMTNASVILEDKTIPKNTKELSEISAKRQQLQEKMPEMEKKVEDLKRKNHLLRTWGGDSSLDSTTRGWDKLRELVTAHQMMFEHQAELVKSSLTGECENLRAAMEAWTARASGRLDVRDMSYDELVTAYEDAYRALDGWSTLADQCDDLMSECEKFNMKPEISETREEAHKIYTELSNLWSPFKEYNEEYQSLARQEWIVFQKKLHLLDDFVVKWNRLLEPYTTVTLYIKRELDQYTELTAVLKYLRGPELTEQHWLRIEEAVGLRREAPGPPVLGALLRVAGNLRKNIKLLQKISSSASSEAAIRSALSELELWYAGARLSLRYHTGGDTRQTPVAIDYKDILAKVEEQQWVVSSLDGGEASAVWEARLRTARSLLAAAQQAQRRWLYLEPILNNDDGDLGIKFRKVDHLFKQVARIIEADPRLSALVQSTRLQPMLDAISEQLNACQSALNQYIDDKRSIFPRLYFLSDDDLLELLGQARAGADGREVVMQSHLKKLFPGLTGVTLGPGGLSVIALCSQYGEQFPLDQPVSIDCSVEVWLNNLEQEIRSSLKNLTFKCLAANNLPEQDPFSLPTQILCLLQNIRFTDQTEKAIRSKELRKLIEHIEKESVYYAAADIEDESEKYKRQSLILQSAYYISVVQSLIENNIVATSDWLWQKQLRFYVINKQEIVAKMGLAEISYSYEYLGVGTGQFVRTETTDESFLILTQALHLGFVGNPFGPAGTGKTESVKALGNLFGRLVLVFNCDEAMDAQCLARLLSGVARCGAWGCFDEFNRLERPALAAAAHQLTALLAALVGGEKDVVLHGRRIPLSPWCGVAVTLNPVGRGYGGRRVLPAALQAALRPLALRPPPSALLATRLLAALAPCDTPDVYRRLGDDLEAVFELAGTLLSGERHYDWGLRALKAAVGSCGTALSAGGAASLEMRRAVLRRVLRLNNLSKLTRYDAERFENILSMVFADVPEEQTEVDPIYSALENSVNHLGLVRNDVQIQKCVELYEQLQQRMGVVIVGPPGSGKTTIRHLLKTALLQQGRTVVQYVVHPKAMRRECLLGAGGARAGGGGPGVLGGVALQAAAQTDGVWSWVVCDGDVDPDWVEALNSVLDDNRVLTLPAGERVQLGPGVGFVFETHSVHHASPATMSRLGVILLSEDSDCSEEILERWARNADFENESVRLSIPVLQEAVKKCLRWMRFHGSDIILKHCHVSLTNQIIAQFEYIVQEQSSETIGIGGEEAVYSAIRRSVAGLFKESAIENFYREMQMSPELPPAVATLGARLRAAECVLRAALPHEHSLVLGPRASAKNILAECVLRETFSTVVIIDCTPILEPTHIIAELKRRNVVCGADGGRGGRRGSAVRGAGGAGLLVRALHRAARDTWGSCRVHDFLLELIQEGGFWSVEEAGPQWHSTGRITLVATAANVNQLSPRLSAALVPIVLSEPDEDELMELSEGYLKNCVTKNIPDNDIASFVRNMLLLYKEVCHTFDSQPHYTWNCSHLRQWCENIKYYSPATTTEVLTAIKAEAAMIFRERLITEEEKLQYNTMARKHLKVDDSEVFYKPKLKSDGVYLERVDPQEWYNYTQKLINQCLTDGTEGAVGVEACEEQRAWGAAAAGALNGVVATCVSAAGSGRRAGAALACSALGATLHTAQHRRHFYAVCKNAITSASEGTRTLLVLSEAVSAGAWLGCMEALLKADSLHALPAEMVPSLGQAQTQTFTNIKQNLGIMICLDKDQENINALLEQYPLLHSTSRMCWLDHWSCNTLRQMPSLVVQRLMKENIDEMSQEDLNTLPVDGFVGIYQSLDAEWLRAPSRYLHFIRAYHHILGTKRGTLLQRRNMLAAGVEALERARTAVSALQGAATQQEEALGVERAAAATALQQLGGTVRAATERKEEMQLLKKNIEEENEKLQIRKKEIEAGLAAVEPVVAAARAAVGDIRTESLSEVRSLRAPPEVVRDVLEGVLRLMGIADTSWHSMKNFLSKRGVKEDIRCLDARSISPAAAAAVERLVERRASSFSAESARRASAAVAPLAAWVHANLEHAKALASVRPLQERQRELHEDLQRAEAELGSLSSGLVAADERVAELQSRLGRHERDAAALEHELARAGDTLRAARDLLERLSGEAASWESDLENISREILELNQRSLLAAGYMIYLPHLTEPQSREHLTKWSALIGFEDEQFSVINFLSSAEEQLQWQAEGLPSDRSAAKNAVILHQCNSQCVRAAGGRGAVPVLLDPEGAALRWVRSALPAHRLVSARADGLLPALHYATRLSGILVITDVEDIEDWWWSASSGCRTIIVSRDTALIGRLLPHVRAEITPLYFTARLDTLLDQLVNYVMENQHPEIYEKCKEIILTKANLQKKQHELQENLLRDLSRDTDILHDAGLLASLKSTRASGAAVGAALAEAHAAEEEARARGAGYRACAVAPARLALAARRLAARRPLVALPARAVRDAFLAAVRRASTDPKNINNDEVTKYSVKKIIERVLLSVHKKDKYTVALHLLKEAHEDLVPHKLWRLLLGNFNLEIEDRNLIPSLQKQFDWMSEDCVRRLAQIKIQDEDLFGRLSLERSESWREFQRSGSPNALPALAPHERTLAAAAAHPPALHAVVGAWLRHELGGACVQGGDALWAAAAAGGRAALLLAPQVTALSAAAARAACELLVVGVDEGINAWEARLESARGGAWLAIAVGASPFPQDLIFFVEAITERSASDFSDKFRLWIVAEEREIPSALTNACVTVILEPPEGVKHNACSTLSSWTLKDRDADATRLLAGAALLHAVVQERRAYIPIGWSRWYGWEWGDVRAAHAAVSAAEGAGARELCCALYAARVSARADRAVLSALSPRFLSGALPARVQPRASLHDYITAFESLPDADEPSLLALPANCRAARDLRAARRLLAGLAELGTTTPIEKGDAVTPLKTLRSLFKKSMAGSPLLRSDYRVENVAGWWGAVCAGEARDAARAFTGLRAGLRAGMGATRETPLAKVPDEWQLLWSGPEAPDEYIEEFCHRARAAVDRMGGRNFDEDYMPKEVDLRSFLRPERVLSALLARRAARSGRSPAALALQARWDCTAADDEDAICVRGLCLSGGEWRGAGGGGKGGGVAGGALEATGADSPPLAKAPPLLLRYVARDEGASLLDPQQAPLPLYESVRREVELCVVRAPLAASLSPRDAALHAVALLVAPLR